MSAAPHPLIAAALAMPKTHAVVTRFADGRERRYEARNMAAAENYAVGERRKMGKSLINRETGETVCVTAVEIVALA